MAPLMSKTCGFVGENGARVCIHEGMKVNCDKVGRDEACRAKMSPLTPLHGAGLLTLDNEPDTADQFEATLIESFVPEEPDEDESEGYAHSQHRNDEYQPLEAQQVSVLLFAAKQS
jgi:hypothetical protein